MVAVLGIAASGLTLAAQVDVYLAARSFDKTLPGAAGPVLVPMWGFAQCTDATYSTCTLESPGATITAAEGDTLVVHVRNELAVATSLVIPGQASGGVPTTGVRAQSFAVEVAAGATGDYTWSNLRAGTFIYHSGTQASIQVPMGLYGALVVQGAGYPGSTSDLETLVVYSEIDPDQNAAVALNPAAPPPAIHYNPQYYLVNGAPYDKAAPPAPIPAGDGSVARTLLLRLVNAGLRSHAAAILGLDMTVRAEDGNVYPTPRTHTSTLLPAGKTLDATVALPAGDRTFPVYDRFLDLTNANQPDGGLLAYLQVGAGSTHGGGPTLTDETYTVAEGGTLTEAAPGVLANDVDATGATLVTGPSHGSLTLNPDGSFTYTPEADFSGQDSFTYSATIGGVQAGATATLNVSYVNDAPVVNADGPYMNNVGATISVPAPGVLGNDLDVDGDALTAVLDGTPPAGLVLNPDGSFTYTGAPGVVTFLYKASDGTTSSLLPAEVTLDLRAPNGPLLTVLGPGGPLTQYRWTLEEDTTYKPDPNLVPNPPEQTLATNFHKSYMPVAAQGGCVGDSCASFIPLTDAVLEARKHYFVSVLPWDAGTDTGHTLGGAQVPVGATSVTVHVNQAPVPTAQIAVLIFRDDSPTNGAPDATPTAEPGLGGFQIILEDAAGRYGAAAGMMMQDAFGNPLKNSKNCGPGAPPPPDNIIVTCPDGTALIKNLPPGKYGVSAIPPAGSTEQWQQTSTIEGKRVIDAWVKANEPEFFSEFGPPGVHVFIGFVSPVLIGTPTGTGELTGQITNMHMSRPPIQTLWDSESRAALAHTTAWVGLNSAGGLGPNIAVAKADADGNFRLTGIPAGSYQLVIWDEFLDQVIAFRNVTMADADRNGTVDPVDLRTIPVFNWFARLENYVFLDENENGMRDGGEAGLAEQNVNLRFRDGTIYQGAPTDLEGFVPFDETFPFFSWLVAEVDFARHKATGVTVTVDAGGDVRTTGGVLNPQIQADGVSTTRTETGPVLTQGFQGFLGQTSVLEWGKKPYVAGENGGISGIVYYATTRAEDDPRLAAADLWEPGVARATVRLYRAVTRQDGSTGWAFVEEVQTDSWDASIPTECPGWNAIDPVVPIDRCYEGIRNFNQVRPGVFDGGYAFTGLAPGTYAVEVVPPPGYELMKEEDKNVVFGDVFAVPVMTPVMGLVEVMPDQATVAAAQAPEPGIAQPACIGPDHIVPPYLSLLPGQMLEAPFANASRPLCNRKEVLLSDRANAVADFYLFTAAPIASHAVGMVLDDLAQEFNPASPQFGEKWAPPFVPVSFRDWTGREISRVYSDQWGRYNALMFSTFSANEPMFSGFSPAMLISCMNDPGPIPDPKGAPGALMLDPNYNPRYGTFCYTFQYMPGTTTYLDTPVVPTSAFAAGDNPVDCAYPDGTPMLNQVNGTGVGPYVNPTSGLGLTILSEGTTQVPNPAYEGPTGTQPKFITRDFGFGATTGTVTLPSVTAGQPPVPLIINSWNSDQITATIPTNPTTGALLAGTGQLVVTRGDNRKSTKTSITVTVETRVPVRVPAGGSIQAAIDAATPGDLVLVEPGAYDKELVILWKPLRLQGAGTGSTTINAAIRPAEKLVAWRTKMAALAAAGSVDFLPGQLATLGTGEGAGITVLAKNDGSFNNRQSHIDGFTFTGGSTNGGIFVNGWAHRLQISNNVVLGNGGFYHGGIRVGVPYLELTANGPYGFNDRVVIRNNSVTQNGGLEGAGGGISVCTGSDRYDVNNNWVCGNFTQGDGAGIAHFGYSDQGRIASNTIIFNQTFNQMVNTHGGGLLIAGEPLAAAVTRGAGRVTVDANLIQGNHAAAGMGGGIRTQFVNGQDVVDRPGQSGQWHRITLTNNIIADNVAGWAGGGISLMDTARAEIWNNTIIHNDSTSTVGATFIDPDTSAPQPAGIVSVRHTAPLAAAFARTPATVQYRDFSNPTLRNNIVWRNRSFYYDTLNGVAGLVPDLNPANQGDCTAGATYWDFGVLDPGFTLTSRNSILTDQVAYDPATGNRPGPPASVAEYCNGSRSMVLFQEGLMVAPALDEGGNFVDVRYGPITLTHLDGTPFGNYHIIAGSPAINNGLATGAPTTDFDLQLRVAPPDIGADEYFAPTP
jgi:FtsP/CotA-like multicopper oxidase with cupredoxin domain